MIITNENLNLFTNDKGSYNLSLLQRRWSLALLGNELSPTGNILTFTIPIEIGELVLSNALVIAAELPGVDVYGGVCFQRLYTAQIGSILCEEIDKGCHVDESCVFIESKQVSIAAVNNVKNSTLFHNIFSLCPTNTSMLNSLELDETQIKSFQEKVIGAFHHLTKNIYLDTQRDGF
jgi:hypothetical protein